MVAWPPGVKVWPAKTNADAEFAVTLEPPIVAIAAGAGEFDPGACAGGSFPLEADDCAGPLLTSAEGLCAGRSLLSLEGVCTGSLFAAADGDAAGGSSFGEGAGVFDGGSLLEEPVLAGSLLEAGLLFEDGSLLAGSLLEGSLFAAGDDLGVESLVTEVLVVELAVFGVGVDPAAAASLVAVAFAGSAGPPTAGCAVGLNGVRELPEVNRYGGS